MKRQVVYPRLVPRLFATTIDLFLLAIFATPIMNFFAPKIFLLFFQDFFIQQHVDLADAQAIASATSLAEFMQHITAGKFLGYLASLFALHAVIMGSFFVGFWIYKGATPGKMILGLRIVDAETLLKPKTSQFVKRFFAYLTALFGIWYILLNERHQALHDKIAGTVVIKR
jgi:uncharacterized RDD family membrane protein YckC